MNKSELICAMAAESGLSKADAKKALDAFISTVTNAMKRGDKVALVGFGTFAVSERSARKGINPATKQLIEIPAKKVVKFKSGAELELDLISYPLTPKITVQAPTYLNDSPMTMTGLSSSFTCSKGARAWF